MKLAWLRAIRAWIPSFAQRFRSDPTTGSATRAACPGYRYAGCRDLAHCRNCSTVEQALRAAAALQERG